MEYNLYILLIYVFALGATFGSFSNVCIYRIPDKKSIVLPGSYCPSCKKHIKWYHNVPIFSWIVLRGKCAYCGVPISIKYILIEIITGLLYLFVFNYCGGFNFNFFLYSLLCTSFIIITFIDLKHKIIPDVITLPGIIVGLISSFFTTNITFTDSLIGFLVGGGMFFLIVVVSRGGMGGGDIKFMAMIGTFLGWKSILLTTFIGSSLGSVIGVGLMIVGLKGRKDMIPFGPFLAIGATISLFYGQDIIDWYFNMMFF